MIIVFLICGQCERDMGEAVIRDDRATKGKDLVAYGLCDECRILLEPDLAREDEDPDARIEN